MLKQEVDVSSSKQENNAEKNKCLEELPEKAQFKKICFV